MKLLVCFKITRDIEHITPEELCEFRDGTLSLSVFRKRFGIYDEAALENALRLADELKKAGIHTTLEAVTVGECDDRFAMDLFALGFVEIHHIPKDTEERPLEWVVGQICALITREGGYSMIFTGKQAGLNESGQFPYILAARLAIPCVSEVIDLRLCEAGILAVSRVETGTCSRVITESAIYSIGDALHPYLRSATLRERLHVAKKQMKEHEPVQLTLQMDCGKHERFLFEKAERNCEWIKGESVLERARVLRERYLEEMVKRG